MAGLNPITELASEHVVLSQLLHRHQEALIARRWARSTRLLVHCRKRLQYCIYLEEECLLSYCLEKEITGCWCTCIAEHRRLDNMLHGALTRLTVARRRGVTDKAVVALLDDEKAMKTLLERHLRREDEALAAALRSIPDEVCSRYVHARAQAVQRKLAPVLH